MAMSPDAAVLSSVGVVITGVAALIYNHSRGQADRRTSDAAMLTADTLSRRADTDARVAEASSEAKWGESLVGSLTALTSSYNAANTNASQWADRYAGIMHSLGEMQGEIAGLKSKVSTLEYDIVQEREFRRRSDEKCAGMEDQVIIRDAKIKEQAGEIQALLEDNRLLQNAHSGTMELVTAMAESRLPDAISGTAAAQVRDLIDYEKKKTC